MFVFWTSKFFLVFHNMSYTWGLGWFFFLVKLFFVTITVPVPRVSCHYYLLLSILILRMGTLQNLLGLLEMKRLLCK